MYDGILLPTDGSDGAAAALDEALDLAETCDAPVNVLYVVDTTYLGSGAADAADVESLRESGQQVVDGALEAASERGIEATGAIRDGDPYREILDYAGTADVGVIVMGTHGRRGLDRFLLGSVTEKVVRTADMPVLTVRANDD
jgi:nucleotide-binding universal stress UspA family protein